MQILESMILHSQALSNKLCLVTKSQRIPKLVNNNKNFTKLHKLILNYFIYLIDSFNTLSTLHYFTMDSLPLATLSSLSFDWMKITGPHLQSCDLLHPGTSHLNQLVSKMIKSTTISKNFYVFFHLLPFLINLKKNAREGKLSKAFSKALRNYIKSILFIAHLVGGLKLLKCAAVSISNSMNFKIDGKIFLWGSFISSLGIFWEDSMRRQQITYFAFVRSIRSSYVFLKRRNILSGKNQMQICFVIIFAFMSYIYTAFPSTVKVTNILEHVWGKF